MEDSRTVHESKAILANFRKYLTYCRTQDDEITKFFKGKPITKCPQCEGEFDLNAIPEYHKVPPELIEALKSTKQWKALLDETEEHCRALMRGKDIFLKYS